MSTRETKKKKQKKISLLIHQTVYLVYSRSKRLKCVRKRFLTRRLRSYVYKHKNVYTFYYVNGRVLVFPLSYTDEKKQVTR